MRTKYKTIFIVIAIVVVVILVWYLFIRKPAKPPVLQTEKPAYGYISQSVTATGTIEPVDTVTVGTQVSGTITVLNADFNSKVKKGQLLAQLDKSLLQATLDQNNATLQTARSQQVYEQSNFARQKLLYSTGAISKADYETATNTYNAAVASVASAQAQVRSAQKNLSYTDIFSPIDGVVLSRNVSIGQTVASSFSTPTLFVIAKDITKMQVQAAVDEADIGNVAAGQRVSFTVDAFVEDSFAGTVEEVRLHPKVSANVVTYTTIINAPNDDMKLKPGMTANIVIYTKEVNNALLISAKAIKFEPDSSLSKQYTIQYAVPKSAGKKAAKNASDHVAKRSDSTNAIPSKKAYVWLKKGNTLVQTPIRVGLNDNTHVEVLKGLTVNDEVVSSVQVASDASTPVAGAAPASPFMPKRGGGTRKK
jgi:HlyD family secretion protein